MQQLQSEKDKEKHALLLNHRQLINNAYSASVNDVETFELKSQLFQFQPKATPQPQQCQKKRKRKFKETATIAEVDNVNEYLNLLVPAECGDNVAALPRHWEDEYTLPQLHGSNTSGKFQKYHTSDRMGSTFIIPHAARFYNHNVDQLRALLPQLLPSYDLIVIDPPWRNKYIRRLNRVKQQLGYAMLDNEQLTLLPLSELTHRHTLVAVWCTNSTLHQQALEMQLLPRWRLRLLHKLRWYKLNTAHQLVSSLKQVDTTQKQPHEMLYLACHAESDETYAAAVKQTELLLSVPSIVHSHKPPLLQWLQHHLQLAPDQVEPNCLELFARYLQPQFTSIGLEVLKLMDERLYDKILKQD
ncbi:N(6)-adenine-specific methyltransferase METTL4 [Drosophila grimshawi]|uniref:GH19433 n=1 Tax=Drosophila grimshawi TaxID=7222 RepID=B4JG85_DROGR|nr:N(6)-adenine-specific methyltransferase METTL4 [Drosophila grimshawi]EDV93652.1 GH19433 [Drosophila grimshawi]